MKAALECVSLRSVCTSLHAPRKVTVNRLACTRSTTESLHLELRRLQHTEVRPKGVVHNQNMAPIDVSSARPIVFSGPSGTGKSTLLKKLFAAHPELFGFSVSHTTRKPRNGEEDGVHYHFTTVEEFQTMIADNKFEEHAKFGGNHYGSSRAAVQAVADGQGKSIDGSPADGKRICVFDIEMEGVKQLKKSKLNPRICFIQPPDVKTLEERLRGRGTDSEDSIQTRLAQAKNEIEYCKSEGKDDKVVVNDDLDQAFKDLDQWVMKDLSQA